MRKKEIEKRFNFAISNSTPNVLEDILAKCKKKKGFNKEVYVMKKEVKTENKKRFFTPRLAGGLALASVCICGVFGIGLYNKKYKVDSIVNFDVNPSVEIKVNRDEDVIKVIPLNKDGEKVLDDMDLERVDLDVAVNAIIGSMLKNGYLSVDENSILVSVKNEDVSKANKLKEDISNEINEILTASSINGSILSQAYDNDKNAQNLANNNDISEGKARLINSVLNSNITDSKGNAYTFESLSKLSINELDLLLSSKETEVSGTTKSGSASESLYIGKEKAKQIAFKNAGVSANNVRELEIELDVDNGKLVYEVEFESGSKEYEYDIHAKTGEIVIKKVENDDDYIESNKTTSTNKNQNNSSYDDDDRYDDDDDDDDRYDD